MSFTGSQQFSFGSGFMYGIPQSSLADPTPVLLGTLQDCSYDITSTTKELYGQLQFAVAVGRGPAKFTGKAKMGSFSARAWNTFFFGPGSDGSMVPSTTGTSLDPILQVVNNETATVSTHVATCSAITNTLTTNVVDDLGAFYTNGTPLTKYTGGGAIPSGSYKFAGGSTGTYTLNSSDAATSIVINYSYKPTTPAGTTATTIQAVNNLVLPMGSAPQFTIVHNIPYATGGSAITLKIWAAMANKLSFDFKNQDFSVPDIDFTMFANSAGQVMDIITTV